MWRYVVKSVTRPNCITKPYTDTDVMFDLRSIELHFATNLIWKNGLRAVLGYLNSWLVWYLQGHMVSIYSWHMTKYKKSINRSELRHPRLLLSVPLTAEYYIPFCTLQIVPSTCPHLGTSFRKLCTLTNDMQQGYRLIISQWWSSFTIFAQKELDRASHLDWFAPTK